MVVDGRWCRVNLLFILYVTPSNIKKVDWPSARTPPLRISVFSGYTQMRDQQPIMTITSGHNISLTSSEEQFASEPRGDADTIVCTLSAQISIKWAL